MPMTLEGMLDNVDAAVFSGDSLECPENRRMLKESCERWLRALASHDDTSTDHDAA